MIDFKINEQGDIELFNYKPIIKPFKIDFYSGQFPKFKISFRTNMQNETNKTDKFTINFKTDFKDRTKYKGVSVVRGKGEKAQSIAIRLKTELNELQNFFSDFGSELNRMRHQDLINTANHERIREYVENAVLDIIGYNSGVTISVDRVSNDPGNFKLETLKISLIDPSGEIIYTYTI